LPVKEITCKVNQDRDDNHKLTAQKVGKTIKSLGIHTRRTTKTGGSAIQWDEDQIERLRIKYGLGEPSDSSENTAKLAESDAPSEVSEQSESYEMPF
jgi:hypothetical protein